MNQLSQTDMMRHTTEQLRPRRWSELSASAYIKLAILAGLLGWFFHIEIGKIVHRWISDSSWSHGFLIPLFSLYFLHQNRHKIFELSPRPSWFWGLGAMLFLLVLNSLNTVQFKIAYGEPLILIAVIGATVLFVSGWAMLKQTWLPIAYLFFAVPLPSRLYSQITIPMRKLAAQMATSLLNVIPDLEASVRGVVIDVFYHGKPLEPSLDVAEACSGMRLLMAFVALGVAMAYLHWRPMWQRLVLLLSTVPIAILCNVVRVTITGLIYVLWDPKYAQDIYHDMLGMAMLPLAFIFYGLLAWLMSNLFVDETEQAEDVVIVRRSNSDTRKEQA